MIVVSLSKVLTVIYETMNPW